jgi:hypothetical protein
MIAAIGFLASVAYGMDWANTFHDFAYNYMSVVPSDQLAGNVIQWVYNFLLQPVHILGSMYIPLAFLLVIAVGGAALVVKRR